MEPNKELIMTMRVIRIRKGFFQGTLYKMNVYKDSIEVKNAFGDNKQSLFNNLEKAKVNGSIWKTFNLANKANYFSFRLIQNSLKYKKSLINLFESLQNNNSFEK